MTAFALDPGHARLKEFVIEATGLTYYANRDEDLADRIYRRLSKIGVPDCTSYLQMLQAGGSEFDALVAELTIGETYFFRHQEQFNALRDTILPDLIERKQHARRLRIWSAGCATGPEAYSLAIQLHQQLAGWDVSILGTDINREFLARANEGRYDDWAFRSCSDDLKRSCFTPAGTSWVIKPEYKQCVSFQYHNLVKHPFPSLLHDLAAFDLILCRNVMIYFNADLIRKLLTQFEQSLVDGGWFLAGHAESNVELFRSFRTVNAPGATVYQKTSAAKPLPLPDWQPLLEPEVIPDLPLAPVEQRDAPVGRATRKQNSLNPSTHFYHALALEQKGQHAESERALRRAIYLDRNFVLAHYCLGLCLQKKRDASGAIRCYRNVLRFLAQADANQTFPHGDEITAADLRELTEMNLEVLQNS